MPIGQLIKLYRIDRKKSTTNVATLAGITVRYLEMIEAGTKTPTLHVLRNIAKVLGVRTSALLGEAPSEDDEGVLNPRLAKVERALFTYDSIPLETAVTQGNLSDRIQSVSESWFTSQTAYTDTLTVLPDLILETEQFVRTSDHSSESCKLAYRLYNILRSVAKHAGRIGWSGIIADRAMRHAEESEDAPTLAAAAWTVGQIMLSNDMPHGALDVAMMSASKMEPGLPDGTVEYVSIYGSLIQCAAIAACRTGDPWSARELLRDKALPAAQHVGEGQNYHDIFFGPTNVGIHMVVVDQEGGEVSEALRMSDQVDISKISSKERRASFLYHVARGYERKGNDTAVLVHLKMAERLRPQDFLYKSDIRNMVGALVRRAKPSYASEVREFAKRIQLLD